MRTTVFGHTVGYLQRNLHPGDYVLCRGSFRTSTRDGRTYTDFVADSFNGVERVYGSGVKINAVLMHGRLCADAEAHDKTVSARIAVQRPKRGDADAITDFFNLVAFDDAVKEELAEYKKSELIALRGHVSISSYEKDGEKRHSTSIVVDEIYPTDASAPAPSKAATAAPTAPAAPQPEFADIPADDEALPFDV